MSGAPASATRRRCRAWDLAHVVARAYHTYPWPSGAPSVLVLGISGGRDSTLLLDALTRAIREPQLGLGDARLGLLHVNYRLRGRDSERDEALVRALASDRDWPLRVVRRTSRAPVTGNVQAWARHMRIAAMRRLCEEIARRDRLPVGHVAPVTAHHARDLAETMLWRMLRGEPTASWATMADPRRATAWRPLLATADADLSIYAERRGLIWREDRSNAEGRYSRNRLRNEVWPTLGNIFGARLESRIVRLASELNRSNLTSFESLV